MGIDILAPTGILVSPLGFILTAYGKFVDSSRYPQPLSGRPFRGANVHSPGSGGELIYLRLVRCRFGWEGVGCGSYHRGRIRQNHLATK